MPQVIKETKSICPVCLKAIDAWIIKKGSDLYMVKKCIEHGTFETVVWRGSPEYEKWSRMKSPAYPKSPETKIEKGCPYDCGLCSEHRQHTCTALIEVTSRCNLNCTFCFADAKLNGEDKSLDTIRMQLEKVYESSGGKCNIQISGGEPTVRDDLSSIIAMAKDTGFKFIQLNTNGIRLSDYSYFEKLKEAGLSSIFLQFDSLEKSAVTTLRRQNIIKHKLMTIQNSKKLGVGMILVCTVMPHVNDDILYKIIELGIKNIGTVRGVHFQPVSYFGRIPNVPHDEDRITLPEVMENIVKQSGGKLKLSNFEPSCCENALCSFHANYIVMDGKLIPITKKSSCCKTENGEEGSRKSIRFVEKNWSGVNKEKTEIKKNSFDELEAKIKNGFFSISAMAFQDAWNLDIERLKDCCIHVADSRGRLIPFCAYNITSASGNKLYR